MGSTDRRSRTAAAGSGQPAQIGRLGRDVDWRRVAAATCRVPARLPGVDEQLEPIECISAVTLLTIDMDQAVTFYRALGFHLLYGGAEESFASFRVGSGYLNLQLGPADSSRRAVWGRVVFWVDDVDAMYQRALQARLVPESAPTDAPWGERYFHIHDPDDHELSFARPLSPR